MKKGIGLFLFLLPLFCLAQPEKFTVYFEFNKYNLDSLYQSMVENAIHDRVVEHITIEAHCDSSGSDSYNDVLSLRRAEEVKKYFTSKNIDVSLIEIKASGKKYPLNTNANESERTLNRRAEISVSFHNPIQPPISDHVLKDTVSVRNTSLENIEDAEVGSTIRLENINFYPGRHIWLPKSEKTIKELLNALRQYPTLEIEIQGHICCFASGDGPDLEPGNLGGLSVNRAKAIYDYLVKNGIDKSRLSYKGFGAERKLIKPERTEEDQETNRRVEIKILKK